MLVDIPGFFFDKEKKRYFKITNGDQRHNSQYTNNTQQARKRRKKILDKPDTPKRHDLVHISKQAQITKNAPDFLDFRLNSCLGLAQLPPGRATLMHLQAGESWVMLKREKLWLLADRSKVLTFADGVVALYTFDSYLQSRPLATVHVLAFQIEEILMESHWVVVRETNSKYSWYKYLEEENILMYISTAENEENYKFAIHGNSLYQANEGALIQLPLTDMGHERQIKFNAYSDTQKVIIESQVLVAIQEKSVWLRDLLTSSSNEIRMDKKIHHVYVETMAAPAHGNSDQRFLRLIAVTTNAVFVYSVEASENLRVSEIHETIKIDNDNLAMPITFLLGDQLLVEISGTTFQWIDLSMGRVDRIELLSFSIARLENEWGRSDVFTHNDKLYILSSDSLIEII